MSYIFWGLKNRPRYQGVNHGLTLLGLRESVKLRKVCAG